LTTPVKNAEAPGEAFPRSQIRCSMMRIYLGMGEISIDALIDRILAETRTVAVVGLSDNPGRPSHIVARYLKERGYRIIPVNPFLTEVLAERAYGTLSDIPEKVDLVNVFRKSDAVPPLAEDAIHIGARFFWMQEGVESDLGRDMLNRAEIPVVMNRCLMTELAKRER
jgi:uncharacterized protein